jgi:hypothetical protein
MVQYLVPTWWFWVIFAGLSLFVVAYYDFLRSFLRQKDTSQWKSIRTFGYFFISLTLLIIGCYHLDSSPMEKLLTIPPQPVGFLDTGTMIISFTILVINIFVELLNHSTPRSLPIVNLLTVITAVGAIVLIKEFFVRNFLKKMMG